MKLGIGLGISQITSGGGGATMPVLEWAFNDSSNLFQDTAGTTPVTTASDPIGRVNSSGSDTRPLTQATVASKPVWNGSTAATLDGVNDTLFASGVNDVVTPSSMVVIATFSLVDLLTAQTVFALAPASGSGYFRFTLLATTGRVRVEARTSANTTVASGDFYTAGITAGKLYTMTFAFHDDVFDFSLAADGESDLVEDFAFNLATLDWFGATSLLSIGSRLTNTTQVNDDFKGDIRVVSVDTFA